MDSNMQGDFQICISVLFTKGKQRLKKNGTGNETGTIQSDA